LKESKNKYCLNCGTLLQGEFCHNCGQKDLPRRQSIGAWVKDFLNAFISFESKFFRTLLTLFAKPGKAVVEFNEGKRNRFYHPARMYVFLSFLFFLLLSLTNSPETSVTLKVSEGSEEVSGDFVFVGDTSYQSVEEYDSIQDSLPKEERDNWAEQVINRKLINVETLTPEQKLAFGNNILQMVWDNLPASVFLLMPVFALYLKLLYFRRDFYYSEHLVFTIYYYDLLYILGVLMLILEQIPWLNWINIPLALTMLIYLVLSAKRVYGQSWIKLSAKLGILSLVFLVTLGITMVLLFSIAFLRL
jgi:hypothetical protein